MREIFINILKDYIHDNEGEVSFKEMFEAFNFKTLENNDVLRFLIEAQMKEEISAEEFKEVIASLLLENRDSNTSHTELIHRSKNRVHYREFADIGGYKMVALWKNKMLKSISIDIQLNYEFK